MPGKKRKATSTKGAPKAKKAKASPPPSPPPKKGKGKGAAKGRSLSEADLDNELNDMIQHAKDGEFEEVFAILDKYPPYVNEKPEERMFCTLHQACFWGNLKAVKKLVETYNADVFLPTKDGKFPVEVAREEGHTAVAKYLETQTKKEKPKKKATASGGRDVAADRNRVLVTERHDKRTDEADMELSGIKNVTLKLGAGGGILCGAVLVYGGGKKKKAVCISDRKFGAGAVTHSGDTYSNGRSEHVIKIALAKMPKDVDELYLTLCTCGPSDLSKFDRPSVELIGDKKNLIRYELSEAGTAVSTVMAVLTKSGKEWTVSPVGALADGRFCGNYGLAEKLIAS